MGKLALFVDHPVCSVDGVNSILNTLEHKHTFKIFTRHKIHNENFFDDVDCVIFPGGVGDVNLYKRAMKHHEPQIKKYLLNGGHYLGICMGAYWAGSEYFDVLKGFDCVQYMGRSGSNTFRPHPKDIEVTWKGKKENVYWYDGCSIVGSGKFETVSSYQNGDIMAGYQGRIGLIGCHLEADESWYGSHSWMRKRWHDSKKRNWELLSDFVDGLLIR